MRLPYKFVYLQRRIKVNYLSFASSERAWFSEKKAQKK